MSSDINSPTQNETVRSDVNYSERIAERAVLSMTEHEIQDQLLEKKYAWSPLLQNQQRLDPCLVDRYPVTVARYREFVRDGGYEDPEHWSGTGWLWRCSNNIESPRWWDPNEPHWGEFLRPDRPVIGVSWYEASAFCAWANRHLPNEAQWEAACRGTDGRVYPWGDDQQDKQMGNRGIGPRCTWPIGFFPDGAGPFGHADLVGNVWQWTRDCWPPSEEDSPQTAMAVRGGSWASRDEHCRSDHRNAYAREGRWSHVGFRTASA